MDMPQQNVSPSGRREVMGGLAKGLEVLRTFSRAKPHMTLSEIAARAGLPAATARRCLNTLEELGYVARNGRQFLLRPPVLEIGAVYLDSMGIQTLTQTKLEELALATGGSSMLAVLSGTGVVVAARASVRTQQLPLEAHVGSRMAAHATALGKVLLAGLGPERLTAWFERAQLDRFTDRTITDRATLMQQVETARREGYATAEEEVTPGAVALAVPVRDAAGRVVAALNVSVHVREANATQLVARHLAALRDASLAVSAEAARMPVIALSAQVS
ncbi:MAG TPA: IclR family transcriptional regulator C-terminal domain-containing protein [Steroidobacteraceae bacterium]|nr:IclR family transcriptional regulator C-terminal domain-containing protein [Steroidobacteraceae bacterium]